MVRSSLPRLVLSYKNVKILANPIHKLEVGHHTHTQRHYLSSYDLFDRSGYGLYHSDHSKYCEPNIFKDVSSEGVKAHMSLSEKTNLLVPISYNYTPREKQVVFDRHRCSIDQWYLDRLSSFRGKTKDWLKYIEAASAKHVLGTLIACVKYSTSSGVSLSSDVNGHFLKHVWIGHGGHDGRLFLPFELTSSEEGRKLDLQIVSNFIYVVYNKRPFEEMKNLDSVTADHWLNTTPNFLKNFYHFLPTFDPNNHCAVITFNPPYLWHYFKHLVNRLKYHVYETEHNTNDFEELMTKLGFSWVDKLPKKGHIIRDLYDEFGGSDTYKNKIDLLKFYSDVGGWYRSQKTTSRKRKQLREGVFGEFDTRFELQWICYRLCVDYFCHYVNKTGLGRNSKEELLEWLGFTPEKWRRTLWV